MEKVRRVFSHDIGIDLGTANTLVYLRGKGVIISEPSVVALNQKTGQLVAVGNSAKEMLGRTPAHIQAVKPLVDGVVSDFEVTEEMLSYLINKAQRDNRKLFGPRVVIGVPSNITNVETRAVYDAAKNAGAREVHIVEEAMAAAIGIRLPIHEPKGSMVIDIGGGTCDIAVVALGGVVRSKNIKVAGEKLNSDIISYVRDHFKLLIGERTAEELKMTLGSILDMGQPMEVVIRGRDLVTGLPREVVISDEHVREAIAHSIDQIIDATREVLETTPPEVLSDIMQRGVHLVGGGALLRGLPELLSEMLEVPVIVSDDPLTAVVRGTGIILEDFDKYQPLLIDAQNAEISATV